MDPAPDAAPGRNEVCDGLDDDCDGEVDEEAIDGQLTYLDGDGDGVGSGEAVSSCAVADGWSSIAGDCDDSDPDRAPDNVEVCNGKDDDCDGVVDWGLRVPGDHGTIAAALEVAPTGSTVCVDPGTYAETLDVPAEVTLVGWAGSELTTVDGQGVFDRPVVSVADVSGAHLEGFRVTGGQSEVVSGLWVRGASASLTDVVVAGNHCSGTVPCGAAAFFEDSDVQLWEFEVVENTVVVDLDIAETVDGVVVFHQSTVSWAGGEVRANDVQLSVVETSDSSTSAWVLAPVYLDNAQVTVDAVAVVDNSVAVHAENQALSGSSYAVARGAALAADYSSIVAADLELARNLASVSNVDDNSSALQTNTVGGAIDLRYSDMSWSGGALRDHVVSVDSDFSGLAVAVARTVGSTLELDGVTISGNIAVSNANSVSCYGMFLDTSSWTADHVELRANEVRCSGSGGRSPSLVRTLYPVGDTRVSHTVVAGNQLVADYSVLGLFSVYDSQATQLDMSFSSITGNAISAEAVGSSVFWAEAGSSVSVENSTVDANGASASGSADTAFPQAQLFGSSDVAGSNPWHLAYSNVYANDGVDDLVENGVATPLQGAGLVSAPASYVDSTSPDPLSWDLHLAPGSTLIDAGDPGLQDDDGSRADIGAYGGPDGDW